MMNRNRIVNLACSLSAALQLVGLSGCGGKSTTAPGIPQGVKSLYVTDGASNSITVYASSAVGDATPSATIQNSLMSPYGVAVDGTGKIYVADSGNNSITVYAAGASGNATPSAAISGASTGLNNPTGVAVDGTGKIYVANSVPS